MRLQMKVILSLLHFKLSLVGYLPLFLQKVMCGISVHLVSYL